MFQSATDHHQGVPVFLVKITELKCELGTHELPDDDQLLIKTCRSAFKCSSK
jgi:hypothetical protein